MLRSRFKASLRRASAIALGNAASFAITNFVVRQSMFPFIRVVSYHDTPHVDLERLRAHFRWYKQHYVNCDRAMLDAFLDHGVWRERRPGLIVSFDDGLRSNAAVAALVLEEFGFTGWFMVPAGVPSLEVHKQREFADTALIPFADENPGEPVFMSWQELRSLAEAGHEVCCHSLYHTRLAKTLTPEEFAQEIVESKAEMERQMGRKIDCFAWVGGEEYSYSRAALEEMRNAAYRRVFSTNCYPIRRLQSPLSLERNHVDSSFGLNEVRLAVGGLYDLLYVAKRRRVNRLIGV